MKNFLRELLIPLGLVIVLYLLFRITIQNSEVFDISMQPTLIAGQRLLVVKVFYQPHRGDIVIVHPPTEAQREFVKRLIGLPGDTIEVKNNLVCVNGLPLNEPYIKAAPLYAFGPYTIPDNHYFVLGDNRNNSNDSHTGWTVTRQEIVGQARLRYWPFDKWGSPGNYRLDEQIPGAKSAVSSSSNYIYCY